MESKFVSKKPLDSSECRRAVFLLANGQRVVHYFTQEEFDHYIYNAPKSEGRIKKKPSLRQFLLGYKHPIELTSSTDMQSKYEPLKCLCGECKKDEKAKEHELDSESLQSKAFTSVSMIHLEEHLENEICVSKSNCNRSKINDSTQINAFDYKLNAILTVYNQKRRNHLSNKPMVNNQKKVVKRKKVNRNGVNFVIEPIVEQQVDVMKEKKKIKEKFQKHLNFCRCACTLRHLTYRPHILQRPCTLQVYSEILRIFSIQELYKLNQVFAKAKEQRDVLKMKATH